jgi:hypothetical protein
VLDGLGLMRVKVSNPHAQQSFPEHGRQRPGKAACNGFSGSQLRVVDHFEVLPFLVEQCIKEPLNHGQLSSFLVKPEGDGQAASKCGFSRTRALVTPAYRSLVFCHQRISDNHS